MPGSDLERRALLLLSQLAHLEATETETEGEEDLGWVMWISVEVRGWATQNRAFRAWVWEDFLGVGSWTETSVIGMKVFLCLRGACRGSHVDDVFFSWSYSRSYRARSRTTSRTSTGFNSSACYSSEPEIQIQSPSRLKTQLSLNFKT
ncbi:hypothetical protein HPG69_017683 [Diceros bicornis minor]|uniref:Uncharacterized protein n=1 Tax=Diceros bicornis minor TaxID=77932 RepID=A0A7J7FH24_DICBM|nr:hypothetical protein HPG69_017683 [Diceros bicornis minor]